tara:strand:+ start:489 stop:962 length:474 start_codon:yes stop_codon:yes gene_type:complete
MTRRKLISSLIFLIIFTSCGFKVVHQDSLKNYNIKEITTIGDNKINYLLKSKLRTDQNIQKQKSFAINLKTQKIRNIKEKNIKNEIIKYELKIIAEIEYLTLGEGNSGKFILSESGDYEVAKIYSNTLNNEKNLVKILTDKISNKINENLIKIVNDL